MTLKFNLLINWSGQILGFAILFLLTPLIVNYLGVEMYGLWSLIITIISLLVLADMGIRSSICRFIIESKAQNDEMRGRRFIQMGLMLYVFIGLFLSILVFSITTNFESLFPKFEAPENIANIMFLILAGVLLSLITSIYSSILTAFENFLALQTLNIISVVVRSAVMLLTISADYGIVGLAGSVFLGNALLFVMTIALVYKKYPIYTTFMPVYHKNLAKLLFVFSTSSLIVMLSTRISNEADLIIIASFLEPDNVTFYSVSVMLTVYTWTLLSQINLTMNPRVQTAVSQKRFADANELFYLQTGITVIIGGAVYMGMIFFGQQFLLYWVGDAFAGLASLILIIAASRIFMTFSSAVGMALAARGKLKLNMYMVSMEALLNISLSIISQLVFNAGLLGIAAATLCSRVVFLFTLHLSLGLPQMDVKRREYATRILLRGLIYLSVSAVICWLAIYVTNITIMYQFILAVMLCGLAMLLAGFFIFGYSPSDLRKAK
ncbi:oligosaccharide flippase family protein [Glaciecola sp. 2405UD65-10]|uniref:oligosaccharide flippase family protein n=1 Tax=Glaciecola sp. 2405UD65-10 TaxID=3397244 RepID=UPI003B5CCFD3